MSKFHVLPVLTNWKSFLPKVMFWDTLLYKTITLEKAWSMFGCIWNDCYAPALFGSIQIYSSTNALHW